ncbi:MAG: hypothetical protein PHY93_12140 [Bacteriovorax sp.]|nr:hypothetical protein [Bacteriovorax sp.]
MMKCTLLIAGLMFSALSFADTTLNEKNILGKYEMNGLVDLKVTILPNHKVEAIQVGIIYDTKCIGNYTYDQTNKEMVADLDCEGDLLHQKIEFANTTIEDLKNGTQVHVSLEYKSENYDLDFDIKKVL